MPNEYPPARRLASGLQPDLIQHLIDPPPGQALRMSQPQQVIASGAAGLQRPGVEQCADVLQRAGQGAVRPAADQCGALVQGVQAEDDPHCGGLSGTVGPDEPGHLARVHGE